MLPRKSWTSQSVLRCPNPDLDKQIDIQIRIGIKVSMSESRLGPNLVVKTSALSYIWIRIFKFGLGHPNSDRDDSINVQIQIGETKSGCKDLSTKLHPDWDTNINIQFQIRMTKSGHEATWAQTLMDLDIQTWIRTIISKFFEKTTQERNRANYLL